MTQNTRYNPNDQFLRRAFDFAYSVTWDDVKAVANRVDRRTRWLIVSILASVALLWVVLQLAQAGIAAIQWATRPSISERLTAPYSLEVRTFPLVDTSVEGATVLPSAAGAFTLQEQASAPTLLEQCLIATGDPKDQGNCGIVTPAQYVQAGTYQIGEDLSVGVVAAQFETPEEAAEVLLEMYRYSRSIGRIGNYALLGSRSVDYFYSSTRDRFAFSWSNGPWVYTANGPELEVLEQLMVAFPY